MTQPMVTRKNPIFNHASKAIIAAPAGTQHQGGTQTPDLRLHVVCGDTSIDRQQTDLPIG